MTLTLDLTPEEIQRVQTAKEQGIDVASLLKGVIANLPQTAEPEPQRDPERAAKVKSLRGRYAFLGVSVDDLHREREADRQKEEQQQGGADS